MIELPKIGDEDPSYDGSRAFSWLAEVCGLSVDLINFLITQVLALLLASLFRTYLHPSKVSVAVRHAFGLTLGLCFGYFCFGQHAIHIAGLPAVCYIVIRTQHPQIVQRMVMIVALMYLSGIHVHRQYYDYGSVTLDITGPLMIITQKVTTLAFSIHDGFTRDEKDLTKTQQYNAIQKLPSPLEFFSYALHFQGLMAGPVVFYRDYIEFIEGYNFRKSAPPGTDGHPLMDKQYVEPSPMKSVVNKVVCSMVCAFVFMQFIAMYPIKNLKEDDFVENTSFAYKIWFIMMSTTAIRFKYYHAWLLADAICNNSGLGFNGYDADGSPKWDMISNINIVRFELGTNFRDCIGNWNMGTNRWLRMIVYERMPKQYNTLLTFSLSALWHGFYPGYYVTFATGALVTVAARVSRKLFRERFQTTIATSFLYDILTCLVTRVFMGYTTFPFVILEFQASLRLYLKIFMCLHLVALFIALVLTKLFRNNKSTKSIATATVTAEHAQLIKSVLGDNDAQNNGITPERMITNNVSSMHVHSRSLNGDNNVLLKKHFSLNAQKHEQFNNNKFKTNDDRHAADEHNNLITQNIIPNFDMLTNTASSVATVATLATAPSATSDNKLSYNVIMKCNKEATRNFEGLFTGIVDFKDDLMRLNSCSTHHHKLIGGDQMLRKRNFNNGPSCIVDTTLNAADHHLNGNVNKLDDCNGGTGNISGINGNNSNNVGNGCAPETANSVDTFLKKEIVALNAAVQQANNVLPVVLSNGHAK